MIVADDEDLLVAEARKVGGDFLSALPVVGGDRIAGRGGGIDDCDRAACGGNAGGTARHDHHAVDATFHQPVDRFGLRRDIAAESAISTP